MYTLPTVCTYLCNRLYPFIYKCPVVWCVVVCVEVTCNSVWCAVEEMKSNTFLWDLHNSGGRPFHINAC